MAINKLAHMNNLLHSYRNLRGNRAACTIIYRKGIGCGRWWRHRFSHVRGYRADAVIDAARPIGKYCSEIDIVTGGNGGG